MTGESHDVGARLRELVIAGELAPLRAYLDGLAGDDLTAARRWVKGTHDVDQYPYPDELGEHVIVPVEGGGAMARVDIGRPVREQAMHRARLLTFARLAGPVAAVKAVTTGWARWEEADHDDLVAAFVDHDESWGRSFATAADAVAPSARGAGMASLLLRAVVETHRLAVPVGRTFHEGWISRLRSQADPPEWSGRTPTLDPLRADPLLPDVVYHQLASGEVGGWTGFGTVLQSLVAEGLIDRNRTLAVALEQLTAGQKPSSQKSLAGVLTALELRPEEVPGGLDYLLSVLSSCHGSAAGVVLALAMELVASDGEVVELARVMAPRSEKALRRTLLAALSPEGLGTRVGRSAMLEAVEALATGDDDATERARYDKARLALGGSTSPEVGPSTALGLWDLNLPAAAPRPPRNQWTTPVRDRLWRVLRTGSTSSEIDGTVADLLGDLARGDITPIEMCATAHELAVEGTLSPTRATGLLEPLFLGGAMRMTWPVALEVADLCAAASRPTPGLDTLLRLLTTYAAEVPGPVELPAHVVGLAGGRSKTAQQATQLVTMLAADQPREHVATHLGLWQERAEPAPWRLAYTPTRDLATIGARIAQTPLGSHQIPGPVRRGVVTSLLLEELAALVADHGAESVRAAVSAGPSRRWSGAIAEAVSIWAKGLLTHESFWAMARTTETVTDRRSEWLEQLDRMEVHDKVRLWTVEEALTSRPLVMPTWWADDYGGWQARLQFLHTCEVLLVVEHGGRVVSTPDVIDGTLGLDHLWERLAAGGTVGPLDLRLALGRLRPDLAHRASETAAQALLDPRVTTPHRAPSSSLASESVQRWVDRGGLHLEPHASSTQVGLWTFDAECAVPWHSCEALATTSIDDGPPRYRSDDVFTVPGRPDVWLRHGFTGLDRDDSVADVGGSIGVHGWSIILDALGSSTTSVHHHPDFAALVRLQDQGRLDPAVAAAAAAARWDRGLPDDVGTALGWERAMLRGAQRGLWPVAVAVVEAGLARDEPPSEVDAIVSVMQRRRHEVPPDAVPTWLAEA